MKKSLIPLFGATVLVLMPCVAFAAAVSAISPTGNPYVDGVLMGTKWAVSSLTFSAPADPSLYANYGSAEPTNNFKAFTATQMDAVRRTLSQNSAADNMTYAEIAESPTQSGVVRYAESDSVSTAWGYYPSTSDKGGDMWFNNSSHYYDNPLKGNYGGLTITHETGHAMGLKHPQDAIGSFPIMPLDKDSVEYTVMSYRSYIGGSPGGYTISASSYPQTLMMFDIAALQNDYGANFTTNAGDTVYKWSATTGEEFVNGIGQGAPAGNKILMTLWDGGGHDTYDLSNYTATTTVDLQPGHWNILSTTQLSGLGSGHIAGGNVANALLYQNNPSSLIEDAVGGSSNDTITGNDVDNVLTGGPKNDTLNGGAGNNTAVYSGVSTSYLQTQNADGSWTVTDQRTGSPDGADTLRNIQVLRFSDISVTIGTATPVNRAPTATNDSYAVDSGAVLTVSAAAGVLANDSDPDGNTLSTRMGAGPQHGTLTLNSNGSFTYTPLTGYYGADSFTYKANDGGLDSNLATVSITVQQVVAPDTTPPVTSITAPLSGATVSGTVTVSAVASDNVSVTKVAFYQDGTAVAIDTTAPYSWSWNTGGSANGSHTLLSKAYDAAGNTGDSAPVSVTVQNVVTPTDSTPPTTSITSPASGAKFPRNSVVTITATASDNVGVTKLVFYANTTAICTITSTNYSCGWRVPNAPGKTYSLTTTAYDASGNIGKSSAVTVTATK